MELQGKKIALFVDNMYQEMELWYPVYRLQEAGAETVITAAEAGKTYTSKLGYPAKAARAYHQISEKEFDGVIIPGGYAPDYIRRYPEALQFVRDLDAQGKLVASVCHGPWVLCSAGILKGRRATCFSSIKDDLIHAGAHYVDQQVVVDANLVTSRMPDDLPAFCRAAIGVLKAAPVMV